MIEVSANTWRLARDGDAVAWYFVTTQRLAVFAVQGLRWLRSGLDPQLYIHADTGAMMSVHADDILITGPKEVLPILKKQISDKITIRWEADIKQDFVRYLGLEWRRPQGDTGGFRVRVPSRYIKAILEQMNLTTCRPVSTPYGGEVKLSLDDQSPRLDEEHHRKYRHLIGSLMWMLQVRPDLAYATKELARAVQEPREVHWAWLRK